MELITILEYLGKLDNLVHMILAYRAKPVKLCRVLGLYTQRMSTVQTVERRTSTEAMLTATQAYCSQSIFGKRTLGQYLENKLWVHLLCGWIHIPATELKDLGEELKIKLGNRHTDIWIHKQVLKWLSSTSICIHRFTRK